MTFRKLSIGLLGLIVFSVSQAQNTNFRDEYLQRYDPQGYSNLKYAEGISEQGASLANALSSNLKAYQNLIDSEDPNEILADFNAKIQEIEGVEDEYIQQSNSFAFEQGQQLGNSISSGNDQGIIYGGLGIIGALNKSSQAKKELAAKKAALAKQRKAAMSKVYHKAEEFNNNMIEQYIKRAAYAESLDDENYNLAFVEHLRCYGESMDKNWSSTNTYWLQNNCSKPRKPSSNGIENKFVARDVQLAKVAKHKYDVYQNSENRFFKESAIAYAANAVKTNPNAANYYLLGKYYKEESSILAMTCMLAAKEAEADFFSGSKQTVFDEIEEETENEIRSALVHNKVDYIRGFLDAGLHRTVNVKGYTFFERVVKFDNPDPLQLYLNKELEGLSQPEIAKRLKGVIMLCAVHNSAKCLQRFIELGTEVDFILNGETPLQAADKSMSPDAYRVLSGGKAREVDAGVALGFLSTSKILLLAQTQPKLAAQHIDAFKDEKQKEKAIREATYEVERTDGYIEFLAHSKEAKRLLKANPMWMEDVVDGFNTTISHSDPRVEARMIRFLTSGLIEFDHVPNRADVRRLQNKFIRESNNRKLVEAELKSTSSINASSRFQTSQKPVLDSEKTITEYDSLNLALYAFEENSLERFTLFDEKFDLSQVTVGNGESLFRQMLLAGFDPGKKMASAETKMPYFSKDFNFSEPINGEHPLTVYLKGAYRRDYKQEWNYQNLALRYIFDFIPLVEQSYQVNFTNARIAENNGTMLHLLVNVLVKGRPHALDIEPFVQFLEARSVDKSAVDDDGKTAYDHYKENKKALYNGIQEAMHSRSKEYRDKIIYLIKP